LFQFFEFHDRRLFISVAIDGGSIVGIVFIYYSSCAVYLSLVSHSIDDSVAIGIDHGLIQ
jgi:hypothetical protein